MNDLQFKRENVWKTLCLIDLDFIGYLNELASSALNLKVLRVRGYNIEGDWLLTKHMKNLCELSLHTMQTISLDCLKYFIREHPNLQVFSFTGLTDVIPIGNSLEEHCRNLREIRFEDMIRRDEDDDYDDDEPKIGTKNNASNPYEFLTSFPNSSTFTFLSYGYRKSLLMALTSHYNVRGLKITVSLNSFTDQCKWKYSVDSETIEINIRKSSYAKEKREPCQTCV